MRTTIAAIAFAVAAFAGTAATAENAVTDARAKLDRLWNADTTYATGPATGATVARSAVTRERTSSMGRSGLGGGVWSDNYRAGRAHPPAGH